MLTINNLSLAEYQAISENLGIDVAECLSLCDFCKADGKCEKQEQAVDVIAKLYENNSIGG